MKKYTEKDMIDLAEYFGRDKCFKEDLENFLNQKKGSKKNDQNKKSKKKKSIKQLSNLILDRLQRIDSSNYVYKTSDESWTC